MMKMTKTLQLLEATSGGPTFSELLEAFLRAGYGASYGKIEATVRKVRRERRVLAGQAEKRKMLKRYYNLLYRLKKQGLITETRNHHGSERIVLTRKGTQKLELSRERLLPVPRYEREKGSSFILVVFDIPEAVKYKRDWLRAALKNLGFSMLQRSVWVAKVKIPKMFLEDLRYLDLVGCVELFRIGEGGAPEHLL